MKRKLTNTGRILDVLNKSFGLTRAELAIRLGESRDTIRKTLHAMLKDERIARVIGDDGVEIYNITDAGKDRLARELAGMTSVIKPPIETEHDWAVEEAEQRGFAKGYATGVQEAQRAAYELGKSSVISKLTEILR